MSELRTFIEVAADSIEGEMMRNVISDALVNCRDARLSVSPGRIRFVAKSVSLAIGSSIPTPLRHAIDRLAFASTASTKEFA
jgi:hypothetical protein